LNLTRKIIVSLFLIFITLFKAQADSPQFSSLTQAEADSIAKEFSATYVHTSVAPATSLGSIWGFEVGLMGGIGETPETEKVVKRASPSTEISYLPHAALLGRVSVPFGVTFELGLLSEITASGVTLKSTSYAIQYTPDFLAFLPVAVAAKLHGSNTELFFNQAIGSDSNGKVTVDTNSFGLDILASANLLIFEPYAGIGFVKTDTDIKTEATGGGSIFAFSSTDNFNSKHDGLRVFVGTELNLLLFNLGLEYGNIMGINRYTAKLSLSF
tara:strand:- start:391 stop:1200 length:810 start_codon:yes stop_codon:yes gene_type:complete